MEFDPTTNPDVQEALSRKYANEVLFMLRLRSGKVAVFGEGRELKNILAPEDCLSLLRGGTPRMSAR